MDFSHIPGLFGHYRSPIELIVTGGREAISSCKERLTIQNLSAAKELSGLQSKHAFSVKHQQQMLERIEELKGKITIECFAEIEEDTLSIPPGFWFMCEHVTGHENSTKPVFYGEERYYQKDTVTELLNYKRACATLVTGAGKSKIIRSLVASLVAEGHRVCVCVPSLELLTQTYAAIKENSHFTISMLGGGKVPTLGCQVLVSTAQSALNEIDKYDALICDELHLWGAESFNAVMAGAMNASHTYGLTGTLIRADGLVGLIHAFTGKAVYNYTFKDGVKDGFLSPVNYIQKFVNITTFANANAHKVKKYIKIHSDEAYIAFVADLVGSSLKKNRPTLVLFKTLEPARKLADLLGVEVASGEYRNPFYKFKKQETELLIGTTSLLSTGLDCPRISTIIFCASGTSEVIFRQSIGRGTRISPGKKDCIVVDVIPKDGGEFERQSSQRRKMAKEFAALVEPGINDFSS
jgi:superfamily II DNA or RNA helicase